jgi:hypothetical protein
MVEVVTSKSKILTNWTNGNSPDLYSTCFQFESRTGHWLFWLEDFMVLFTLLSLCQDGTL